MSYICITNQKNKTMVKYFYLFSQEKDEVIFNDAVAPNEKMDKEYIKSVMNNHLESHPNDTLEWTLEDDGDSDTVGDTILDFYEMRNGKVCKVLTKGNRNYYKPLKW